MNSQKPFRVAMPAWEIGRVGSGLGVKVGGLGVVVEELPPALVSAAAAQGVLLEIETLTPCFAHYDRSRLIDTGLRIPVTMDGYSFSFEVYKHTFPDGQTVVYFWDEWQLSWTGSNAIYPNDPALGFRLYALLAQAMAGYIRQGDFDAVHSHDYHVGLVPFYLGDAYLQNVAHHFTIHNATYQGRVWPGGSGYELLWSVGLNPWWLYHKYFEWENHINVMKAVLLKTHEMGGKITTVSGDLSASWGYAAELRESYWDILNRAQAQKWPYQVGSVFHPNQGLTLLEQLPVIGITNGMDDRNKAETLPELRADVLQQVQARRSQPIFRHPVVQEAMLNYDHDFSPDRLAVKVELKRLLHLETFGTEPLLDPILITVVGRLVGQKNLGLVAEIVERTLAHDPGVKFLVLASAPDGESEGKATERYFYYLSQRYPDRVYFNNGFNQPLSKLILAGGDFCLVPSRFEPCGLVDYEASLLGNVVIGRRTGGLPKVAHCAYLYDWLDISDRQGEANAFFGQIAHAIDTYRRDPSHHRYLMITAMQIDASWSRSAAQYLDMYRFGRLVREWWHAKSETPVDVAGFARRMRAEAPFFGSFFQPVWGNPLDWELKSLL